MSLRNPELETVLRYVDKVFDFRAERDRLRVMLAALEAENKGLAARVAELEARCKRLEEAARAVYLDSIASDHPWTELETRNMHALRDVLEAKP